MNQKVDIDTPRNSDKLKALTSIGNQKHNQLP